MDIPSGVSAEAFTISPSSQSVARGTATATTYTVTVNPVNGFAGTVGLAVTSPNPLPTGVTVTTTNGTVSTPVSVSFTTTSSTPIGNMPIWFQYLTFIDPLRYGTQSAAPDARAAAEYAFVRLRYKLPGESASRLIETPVRVADTLASVAAAPQDTRFAAAVAAFGQKLRGESRLSDFTYIDIAGLANAAKGSDPLGVRAELVQLVRAADGLAPGLARR